MVLMHGNDPPAIEGLLSLPKISELACKAPWLSQLCTFQLILCTKSKEGLRKVKGRHPLTSRVPPNGK